MSNNNLREIRISDIETFDGSDWEIQTGVDILGVSYLARRENAVIKFTDEKEIKRSLTFRNQSTITFRGSFLIYDPTTITH